MGAIGRISEIIVKINGCQLTITSAVEEQTATAQEMSRSVSEATLGSSQITANIDAVSAAAAHFRGAGEVLAAHAEALHAQAETFTYWRRHRPLVGCCRLKRRRGMPMNGQRHTPLVSLPPAHTGMHEEHST